MKAKFAPLLAAKLDWDKVKWPVYQSQKLDGIRALVRGGKLLSRSLKPIPNKFIRASLERKLFEGLDGELIVGSAWGEGVYQRTESGVMTREGKPDFNFYVFDDFTDPKLPYKFRYQKLLNPERYRNGHLVLLIQELVYNPLRAERVHRDLVANGAEGSILRSPDAPYKYGRSTTNEGILLKLVNYETEEATIRGVKEQQHNGNPDQRDNLGHAKRSSAKAGKTPAGVLGSLVVESENYRDLFDVGTGFTAEQRVRYWAERGTLCGKIIRFKHKPFGQVDVPRHPVFQGFRDKRDL